MKRFLTQLVLFSLLIPIPIYIKPLYLLVTEKYKNIVAGKEIYYSIRKSKQKSKAKKLLLGDSVAKQLFSNEEYNTPVNSLSCNQSIGFPGNYFLLHNYIQAGNRPDTVYLLFSPHTSCFQNNLDQVFTFHYFLKPFNTKEYSPFFSENVVKQIHKIPYYYLSQEPYILTSNWAPEVSTNHLAEYTFLSPIAIEYLQKIKQLSQSYHFKLILVPTPVKAGSRSYIENIDYAEITPTRLETEFKDYFRKIIYLNDTLFIDGLHLKNPSPYTTYYSSHYIR